MTISVEEFESETAATLCAALEEIAGQLNKINVLVILQGHREKIGHERLLSAQLLTVCNSIVGLVRLCSPLSMVANNAIVLSRRIYDASLLAAFVLTERERLSKHVELYSVAYALTNGRLNKRLSNGSRIDVSAPFEVIKSSQVNEAKSKFITAGGKLRPCFHLNREQQIQTISKISEQSALCFSIIEQAIYSRASEDVHGSLASFDLSRIEQEILGKQEFLEDQFLRAFTATCLSVEGFARMIQYSQGTSPLVQNLIDFVHQKFRELEPSAFED